MKELITLSLSGFWQWLGFVIILGMGLAYFGIFMHYIFKMFNRYLRHLNIKCQGYPPAHLDADGDNKEIAEIELKAFKPK